MRFRVVTINTGKEDRPYWCRLELLAEGLRRLQPDIVLLQETVNTPDNRVNTTRSLARALGLTAVEAPARCKLRRIEGEIVEGSSGLGLLSRLPVSAHERLALPSDPRDGERIALLARLATPGGDVLVINTHLTYLRHALAIRQRQIETIFAHPWLGERWAAAVLGGDLNTDLPDLPALLARVPARWSLRDAYVAGGGAEPRVTMPAYWAANEDRCLDYLISIVPAGEAHPRWSEAAIVLTQPDADGIFPSDHRGVAATIEIETPIPVAVQ
jgi:endonuclease/exonuclease/phosphatase family metal-dependent hydrolase